MKRLLGAWVLALAAGPAPAAEPDPLAWPAVAAEHRPWTRWWWLGSAVDRENLTRSLDEFKRAGIGGVEICPIYGAKGYEEKFIDFLSPRWVEMLAHTTAEAKRLGLGGFKAPLPRAHFHDSYEYYNASWTDDLFAEFRTRRGYDLREHLPALFGDGPADTVARVKCDYRETLSDLHRQYLLRWTEWCHTHGGLSRNQAHGG